MLAATDEALRAAGLSRQKIAYGRAIAGERPRLRRRCAACPTRRSSPSSPASRASGSGPPRSTRCSRSAAPTSSRPGDLALQDAARAALRARRAAERAGAARDEPRLVAVAGGGGAAALGLLPGGQPARRRALSFSAAVSQADGDEPEHGSGTSTAATRLRWCQRQGTMRCVAEAIGERCPEPDPERGADHVGGEGSAARACGVVPATRPFSCAGSRRSGRRPPSAGPSGR